MSMRRDWEISLVSDPAVKKGSPLPNSFRPFECLANCVTANDEVRKVGFINRDRGPLTFT
jgi:hypothetical protein